MTIRRMSVVVVLMVLVLVPVKSRAGWHLRRVDSWCQGNIAMAGDYLAYTRINADAYREEVLLYNTSSGEWRDLSQGLPPSLMMICTMKEGQVWFYSNISSPRSSSLYRYDISSEELSEEIRVENGYVRFGAVEGDNLVVVIDDDYWLCARGQRERLTFSGDDIYKDAAVMFGDSLLWEGYQDYAGPWHIYLTDINSGHTERLSLKEQGIHSGLQGDGTWALWGWRSDFDHDADKEIYLYDISNRKMDLLETSAHGALIGEPQIAVDYPKVIYVQETGSQWGLMWYDIVTGLRQVLWRTDIPIHSPRLRGNGIIYIGDNCAQGDCEELYHYDFNTHSSEQITTMGQEHYFRYPSFAEDGQVAFLTFWASSVFGELFLARANNQVPPSWGTAAAVVPDQAGSLPESLACCLLLLVLPLLVVLVCKKRLVSHRPARAIMGTSNRCQRRQVRKGHGLKPVI